MNGGAQASRATGNNLIHVSIRPSSHIRVPRPGRRGDARRVLQDAPYAIHYYTMRAPSVLSAAEGCRSPVLAAPKQSPVATKSRKSFIYAITRRGDHLPRVRTLGTRGARGFPFFLSSAGSLRPLVSSARFFSIHGSRSPAFFLPFFPFFARGLSSRSLTPPLGSPGATRRYAREDTSPAETAISHVPPREPGSRCVRFTRLHSATVARPFRRATSTANGTE